MEGTMTETKY